MRPDSADEFLAIFHDAQRRLGQDDRTMCRTVPSDCDVRVARIALMETAIGTRQLVPRDALNDAQHAR